MWPQLQKVNSSCVGVAWHFWCALARFWTNFTSFVQMSHLEAVTGKQCRRRWTHPAVTLSVGLHHCCMRSPESQRPVHLLTDWNDAEIYTCLWAQHTPHQTTSPTCTAATATDATQRNSFMCVYVYVCVCTNPLQLNQSRVLCHPSHPLAVTGVCVAL